MAEGAFQPAQLLRFGPFELDPRAGELRKGGVRIRLQDQPLQILTMLLAAPGQVVLREEIQRKLWPNHTVVEFDHGINAAVKRLRAALGDSADAPLFIETLARRGYRFIGSVGENSSQGIQSKPVSNGITDTSDLVGQTVGHYRVVAKLGSGGSGVVYRAEDLKLGRMVALKFLHTVSEETPVEVRERFRREARAAATLNHPHICTVYGIEDVEGQQMIVMELLEGETLADRLVKGPLPLDEALKLGVLVARALDAGHRLGIVHRDFKPANVMLTNRGAKILDFGLAKQQLGGSVEAEATGTQSLTQSGVVVGTLQYMPPEQLAGKEVDWRCDIWAFGAVLYEMVTGKKAFDGLTHLQPPLLWRLVNDCQAKDPLSRKQSLHDVALELEGMAGLPQVGPALIPVAHRTSSARVIWAGFALALLVSGAGILVARREAPRTKAAAGPIHLLIDPPPGRSFADSAPSILLGAMDSFALSPDGSKLAAPVMDGDRSRRLWVRSLSSLTGEVLANTEGASQPFWSPDSKSIGYFAHEKLRVIPAMGGPSIPVVTSDNYRGGTWNASGTILFGRSAYPISRVPASGGTASPAIPAGEGSTSLRGQFPWFLPDGRRFLFYEIQGGVSLGDLGAPNRYLLIPDALQSAFVSPDYLLFLRAGRLMAQKLNLGERRLEGEPAIVAGGENPGGSRIETFSVSETGVLVYRSAGPSLYQLTWHNRDGRPSGTVGAPAAYQQVFLSPNEKLAAVNMVRDAHWGLWLLHLDNQILTQLASEADAMVLDGFWSPDSRQLVYQVLTATKTRIMTISLGEMTPKLFYEDAVRNYPDDWSPDNKWIIYRREGRAVYIVPPDGKAKPRQLLDAPYMMDQFQFSPDSQWLAYNSLKSGQWEVYVSRFPSMTDTRQVSTAGGCQPIWRKDGKELFYLTEDGKLMAIPVTQGSNLETGAPKELFPTSIRVSCQITQFAASRNGDKFLLIEPARPADSSREPIHILINWQALLPH